MMLDVHVNDDEKFNLIYGESLCEMAEIHFSPIDVSIMAAQFLAQKSGKKVLDIGSGAGKFCIIGSLNTDGYFVGIEQRQTFIDISIKIVAENNLQRIEFLLGNVADLDFAPYDAFYIFNPFYENISRTGIIDLNIELNRDFYESYSNFVKNQLNLKPIGTRLATYFSYSKEIPSSYKLQSSHFDDKLKLWEKES
jgi:SAM-dependent methyltransferase